MERRKSLNDLVASANKIKYYPQFQTDDRGHHASPWADRYIEIWQRYFDNICYSPQYEEMLKKAKAKNSKEKYWLPLNDHKFPQSVYRTRFYVYAGYYEWYISTKTLPEPRIFQRTFGTFEKAVRFAKKHDDWINYMEDVEKYMDPFEASCIRENQGFLKYEEL